MMNVMSHPVGNHQAEDDAKHELNAARAFNHQHHQGDVAPEHTAQHAGGSHEAIQPWLDVPLGHPVSQSGTPQAPPGSTYLQTQAQAQQQHEAYETQHRCEERGQKTATVWLHSTTVIQHQT